MKQLLILFTVFLFLSCDWWDKPSPSPKTTSSTIPDNTVPDKITFAEVSKPYLDSYGEPEDVYTFTSGNFQSIDWWWWSQGFEITFEDSPYDDVYGWAVSSTYSFSPLTTGR